MQINGQWIINHKMSSTINSDNTVNNKSVEMYITVYHFQASLLYRVKLSLINKAQTGSQK